MNMQHWSGEKCSDNYSEPYLDSAALHLVMASRHMKLYEKVLIHASMIRTFPCNFAWLWIVNKIFIFDNSLVRIRKISLRQWSKFRHKYPVWYSQSLDKSFWNSLNRDDCVSIKQVCILYHRLTNTSSRVSYRQPSPFFSTLAKARVFFCATGYSWA